MERPVFSTLLSATALAGVLLTLGLCGALARRADLLGRLGGRDIEYLDASPSLLDLIGYAAPRAGRIVASLAPLLPSAAFLWFLYLWGYAVGIHWPRSDAALAIDAVTLLTGFLTTGPLQRSLRRPQATAAIA